MQPPQLLSSIIGWIAYRFNQIQPLIPIHAQIIASAIFPIFAAAHASLSRPSSAAKSKQRNDEHQKLKSSNEHESRMQHLTISDALVMPILAGIMLTGLYFVIKYLDDPVLINKILNGYFALFGVYATANFISDGLDVFHSILFPHYYMDLGRLYYVDPKRRLATPYPFPQSSSVDSRDYRTNPLPALFSRVPFPSILERFFWFLHIIPSRPFHIRLYIHKILDLDLKPNIHNIEGFVFAMIAVGVYNLTSIKPWILTNLLGFSFSYEALQVMSPDSFRLGLLLLSVMFAYDIYFVFFTPMMAAVATVIDLPVKLVFPNGSTSVNKRTGEVEQGLSMLGLGDVVLPGMVIGLALRLDLWQHYLRKRTRVPIPSSPGEDIVFSEVSSEMQHTSHGDQRLITTIAATSRTRFEKAPYEPTYEQWGDRLWTSSLTTLALSPFSPAPIRKTTSITHKPPISSSFAKPYFHATLIGYTLGLLCAFIAMQISAHPQPALLYLVPGVLGSVGLTAWWKREILQVWYFVDGKDIDDEETEKDKAKKDGQAAEKKTWTQWMKESVFLNDPLGVSKTAKKVKARETAPRRGSEQENKQGAKENENENENEENTNTPTKSKPKSKSKSTTSISNSKLTASPGFKFSISLAPSPFDTETEDQSLVSSVGPEAAHDAAPSSAQGSDGQAFGRDEGGGGKRRKLD